MRETIDEHTATFRRQLRMTTRYIITLNLINASPVPGKAEIFAHWAVDDRDNTEGNMNLENLGNAKYYPTVDGDNNITPGAPTNARLTLTQSW